MNDKRLAEILQSRAEKYPYHLERQFARVFKRVMELWGTEQVTTYFVDLLVDRRGNRTGFPPKVAEEIFFLSELHSLLYGRNDRQPQSLYAERDRVIQAERKTQEFRAALEARSIKFVAPEFFRCVSGGDLSSVVLFVNAGMGIDTPNEQGWTPLMVALFEGREEVALFLIKKGADVNFRDRSGYRPIHWAAFQGYAMVVREIVAHSGDLHVATDYGYTPLLQAAARGHTVAVQVLLAHRANPDTCDSAGWAPIHKASSNNHIDTVRALVQGGAALGLGCADGATALHIAARLGHEELVGYLLEAGASRSGKDFAGATPLHAAAQRNQVGVIDRLLRSYPHASPTDKNGATPLVWAIRAGSLAAARRLIQAGARIQESMAAEQTPSNGAFGRVAGLLRSSEALARAVYRLHRCVARGDFVGALREIAKGADLNLRNPDGRTPLDIAAERDNFRIWWLLVESGAGQIK